MIKRSKEGERVREGGREGKQEDEKGKKEMVREETEDGVRKERTGRVVETFRIQRQSAAQRSSGGDRVREGGREGI